MDIKQSLKSDEIYLYIGMGMGSLLLFGKHFLVTTELQKVEFGILAMLWIIFGYIYYSSCITHRLIKELYEKDKGAK